jgi:opacity protein-like surface antigen
MKRVTKEAALVATTVLCMCMNADAQFDKPRYEFGINVGFLVYQGDLTPKQLGSFETQKFSVGLHASRIMSPSFSWRANLLIGKLKGDDAVYSKPEYRQQRNFNFTSPTKEISIQMVWNPLGRNYIEKGFSPYVFAGVGLSFLKVKRDWSQINTTYFSAETSDIWAGLAADSAHALPKMIPVVPIGAGVKYFFTPRWAINAETSYRLTATDYLDGFSQAANPKRNDHYLNYSIGVVYRTGNRNRLGCPTMKY